MIQDDQNNHQMCSTNSSGGDESGTSIVTRSTSSKKLKQKKVPQRGLGVAQLEKIRMEEQQHKKLDHPNNTHTNTNTNTNTNNHHSSSTLLSSTNSQSSHQNATPTILPKITNNQKPSKPPCLPYSPPSPPPMPVNLSPQNPIFRTRSLPNTDNSNFHLDSIPSLTNPINGDGFQVRWPSMPVHGNVSFPKMWHPTTTPHHDHNKGGENLVFQPNLSLPYDSISHNNNNNNVAPLPDMLPRSTCTLPQLQPPPPPSNSLVNNNVSSMNLSSSSVLNFPMEPPSNQSFYGTYSSLLWPDDDKMMAGMKRSCPFSIDSPPIPKFHSKYTPVVNNLLSRSEESTSGANGGTTYNNLDPSIPIFRDMPSCPALPEPAKSRKMSRLENGNGNSHTQEFLTLMTPPTITSSSSSSNNNNSRLKQFCKLDGLPYQVSIEEAVMESTRKEGAGQKPSLLSFFPPPKLQAAANNHDSCSEVGESIDLNLRL